MHIALTSVVGYYIYNAVRKQIKTPLLSNVILWVFGAARISYDILYWMYAMWRYAVERDIPMIYAYVGLILYKMAELVRNMRV